MHQLVNPAYQQLLPRRELLGKPLLVALPELNGHQVHQTFQEVYQSGVTHQEQAIRIPLARPQDGVLEERYFNYIQQARYDEQGRVDGVVVFAFEVTGQVLAGQQAQALAQELSLANLQLRHSNLDMDNFIYTASHDLKAPIANIEGLLQILQRSLPADSLQLDRVKHILSLTKDSVERFKRTIANLTEVVKLQKEHSGAAVPVPLSEVIREVLLDLEPVVACSQAVVQVNVQDCLRIHFSEKNLRSVVYNLISNALKYRSLNRVPLVNIHCRREAACSVLSVEDNGMGMDLSVHTKLFSMFKRFHPHVEGSGIGLYMIKRMVENAGGRIEVESRVEVGTTFRVYFPQ